MSDGNIVAHVGDRIDHDVYMANESGWTSVFITRSLPESLTGVNPYSRPSFMGKAFQEKWVAEHHAADDFDIKLGIPNMVIGSVSELIGGLNT
ncbi:hypothetical protein JCM19037_3392 [Geomicrobium sp. JCM 19037]|nr:hypothetical protein JCM19037_3392 [Geomicrobium sp. JCM 19037]